MKRSIVAIVITLLVLPLPSYAATGEKFAADMVEPYGFYKQALSLTSKAENQEKALQSTELFLAAWGKLTAAYAKEIPEPFAGRTEFTPVLQRSAAVGQEAMALLQGGKVLEAHLALEEIRYLLWEMRVQAGLTTLNDKVNDFHEAMEIVLEGMDEHSATLAKFGKRYGGWLAIKWEEVASLQPTIQEREIFAAAVAAGRQAIADSRKAMAADDLPAAKKAAAAIKGAYKKIFALAECS